MSERKINEIEKMFHATIKSNIKFNPKVNLENSEKLSDVKPSMTNNLQKKAD